VVLMASLSMPVLMHWATVPIPAYSSSPDVVIASPPAIARRAVQPTEFPLEVIDPPSAADGVAGHSQESVFADALFGAIDSAGEFSEPALAYPAGIFRRLGVKLRAGDAQAAEA
jgi:hypothetical protein